MNNWQEQQKQVATGVTDGSRKTPQTEALKLALAVLEKVVAGWTQAFAEYKYDSDIPSENQYRDEVFAAITAIKEALAQPDNTAKLYEELRSIIDGGSESFTHEDAVQYLKDKLAQPEQEPVAIVDANDEGYWAEILPDRSVKVGQHLYAEAPQRTWVGLTGGEVLDVLVSVDKETVRLPSMLGIFARAIEAKLKEKNT